MENVMRERKKLSIFSFAGYIALLAVVAVMLLCGENVLADASSDYTYTVNDDGTLTITGYTGSDTEIEIPAEIDGKKVTVIGFNAFYNCQTLEKVVIDEGISEIREHAFSECNNLKKIIIPSSVESLGKADYGYTSWLGGNLTSAGPIGSGCDIEFGWTDKIPDGAFYNYENLVDVTLPESITSIGEYAFAFSNISEITITKNVTALGYYVFYACDNLKIVTVENGSEFFGEMAFWGCDSITTIRGLTGSYAEKFAREKGYTFESIGIYEKKPGELYNYIENDDGTITITGYKGFDTEIVIPSEISGKKVTVIGKNDGSYTFENRDIKSVVIPESVKQINKSAFVCDDLSSVTIYGRNVQIDMSAFTGHAYVKYKTFRGYAGSDVETYANKRGYFFVQLIDGQDIVSAPVSNIASETYTGSQFVELTTSTEGADIYYTMDNTDPVFDGDSVANWTKYDGSIQVTDEKSVIRAIAVKTGMMASDVSEYEYYIRYESGDYVYALNKDGGITLKDYSGSDSKVDIPDTLDEKTVTRIDYCTFFHRDSIIEVTIPKSVTSMEWGAFYSCNNLKVITIENGSKWFDGSEIKECNSITTIRGLTGSYAEAFAKQKGYAFESIGTYDVPEFFYEVNEDGETLTITKYNRFVGDTVEIPSEIDGKKVTAIGNEAFEDCDNITTIRGLTGSYAEAFAKQNGYTFESIGTYDVPEFSYELNEDGETLTITGYNKFADTIEIPAEIDGKKVTVIGVDAFDNCYTLEKVVIDEGILEIQTGAFDCGNLKKIIIPSSVENVGKSNYAPGGGGYSAARWLSINLTSAGPIGSGCDIEFGWTDKIPDYAFFGCQGLVDVTLPESITSIGSHAFYLCSNITEITIPKNVTFLGYNAFACDNLKTVTIENGSKFFNDAVFDGCSNITTIRGLTGSYAEVFAEKKGYEFESIGIYEKKPEELYNYIENDDGTVTITGYNGFDTEIVIPSEINGKKVTAIGKDDGSNTFENRDIKSVTIPASVKQINRLAFVCDELSSITIYGMDVKIDTNAFTGHTYAPTKYKTFRGYAGSDVETYANERGYFFVQLIDGQDVVSAPVSNIASGTYIGSQFVELTTSTEGADIYYTMDNTTPVLDGDSVSNWTKYDGSIQVTDENSVIRAIAVKTGMMASEASEYEYHIKYESGDYVYVLNDGNITLKSYKGSDSKVDIPDTLDGKTVTKIDAYTFHTHYNIIEITIPKSITSMEESAFYCCNNLKVITIENGAKFFDDSAFVNCNNITTIRGLTGSYAEAFAKEKGYTFESIGIYEVPEFNYDVNDDGETITITGYNKSDDTIEIPAEIDGKKVTVIGTGVLAAISTTKAIVVPEGVTTIKDGAFSGNSNLVSVTIPESVTSIGYSVFSGCNVNLVIYGYSGSAIESYAKNNNLTFEAIGTPVTPKAETVTSDIPSGIYNIEQKVTLSTATEGAVIYYTTDGSEPEILDGVVTNWKKYDGAISILGEQSKSITTTIRAIALCQDMDNSDIAEFTYTINIPHEHNYSDEWTTDNTYHWHECIAAGCAEASVDGVVSISGKASHTAGEWMVDKEATVEAEGSRHKECTECGYVMETEKIDKLVPPHKHNYSDKWTTDNTYHWHECIADGCAEASVDGLVSISGKASHTAGEWIVDKEATVEAEGSRHKECTECGYVMETEKIDKLVPPHKHNYSDKWTTDNTYHWHECIAEGCAEASADGVVSISGKAKHTAGEWIVDKEATVEAEGSRHKECTVCGYVMQTESIAKLTSAPNPDPTPTPTPDPDPEPTPTPDKKDDNGNSLDEIGWHPVDGESYWYENGERQGVKYNADGSIDTSYRGKEIYDPSTDAWYWLDNVQNGAIAKSKDVYQESLAGDWGETTDENGNKIGKWVRYDENGHMVKGWQTTEAGTYYFDLVYGTMAKGNVTIDGKNYIFDQYTGILLSEADDSGNSLDNDGWHPVSGESYWYENGERQGVKYNDDGSVDTSYRGKEIYDPSTNAWYWLDNVQNGAIAKNKDVYQDSLAGQWGDRTNENGEKIGKWVRYDENGHMVKGWQTTEAGTYYFDPVFGTMAKGEAVIDGQNYYFDIYTGVLQ